MVYTLADGTQMTRRKRIPVTGAASGAQIDFQILMAAVAYAPAMQNNFNDLRFTQANMQTLIDAWLQDKSDGSSADVWGEFPTTPANGMSEDYWMYYGNAGAASNWDGAATFPELFDDFDTLDTEGNPTLSTAAWGDSVLVNGTYYMFYADDSGATANIRRTTTSDFKSYSPDPGTIVISGADGPAILKDPDGITPVQYDGKYWLAYTKGGASGIYIAYATTITGAWTESGKIIDLGTAGQWDDVSVYTPSIVKDGSTYYIFYQGNDGSILKIGYATASTPNGTWTKSGDNPVLSPSAGQWDNDYVIDPVIRKFDSTYYLFYSGRNGVNTDDNGYATSNSITGTWSKYASNPILVGEAGKWDIYVTYANIFKIGDTFYQNYDGHDGVIFAKKGIATTDSLTGTWTKCTGKWAKNGTPTVATSELLINADGEYVRSINTFQYKALKIKAKFAGLAANNSFQYFGFQSSAIAAILNEEMFFSYDTPDLKVWSGDADGSESTSIYDASYFDSYHLYEILWKSGEAKFLIDDVLKDTDTTEVCTIANPVGIYNYGTAADLYVDWLFVRKYVTNPPTYQFGAEEHQRRTPQFM